MILRKYNFAWSMAQPQTGLQKPTDQLTLSETKDNNGIVVNLFRYRCNTEQFLVCWRMISKTHYKHLEHSL